MTIWWVMLVCGVITFALRFSFIAAEGRMTFLRWFLSVLPFIPVATLTALIMPELLAPQGVWSLSWHNSRLIAGLVAILIAAATRSVLWTLVGGFTVLGVWGFFINQ